MFRLRQYSALMMVAVLGLTLATARAQTQPQPLPRLPQDFIFPPVEGSPGQVKFSHATHVNAQHASCTTCHPRLFKILQPGTPADGVAMGHEAMEQERHCGACHNDKAAFGLTDGEKCLACHSVSGPE